MSIIIKLRVMNPTGIAAFYRDMLDLREADKALEDPNYYLTDGKMTLDHRAVEDERLRRRGYRPARLGAYRV